MNLKELMLNYLREEGFCPKEEEFGLAFKCEGLNFIFSMMKMMTGISV